MPVAHPAAAEPSSTVSPVAAPATTARLAHGCPLKSLGMTLAFDSRRADFSGIAPIAESERLFVSDVLHKAFVHVDEAGTEAAAATAVIMSQPSAPPPSLEEFRADHPFLFFIRHHATGLVLFMGRVTDPSQA